MEALSKSDGKERTEYGKQVIDDLFDRLAKIRRIRSGVLDDITEADGEQLP